MNVVMNSSLGESLSSAHLASHSLPKGLTPDEAKCIAAMIEKALPDLDIEMFPQKSDVHFGEIESRYFGERVIACDFYVDGVYRGKAHPWGYELRNVRNVDHHAPTREMCRAISSGVLASYYVRDEGVAGENDIVVVNHADCDSVLSSAIVKGIVPPHEAFSAAVIAADHSGHANPISDLLQSLEGKDNLEFSLRNLARLLKGAELEPEAAECLKKRMEDRARAHSLVEKNAFAKMGEGMYVARVDKKIDTEYFPALLPEAQVIMLICPMKGPSKKNIIRIRLGLSAPEGLSLHDLDFRSFDRAWGGRWNAGSNNRTGGTSIDPRVYIEEVYSRFTKRLEELKS